MTTLPLRYGDEYAACIRAKVGQIHLPPAKLEPKLDQNILKMTSVIENESFLSDNCPPMGITKLCTHSGTVFDML